MTIAALLTACSSEGEQMPIDGQHLRVSNPDISGEVCYPEDDIRSSGANYGHEMLVNTSERDVELVKVRLNNPRDVDLVGSFIAPERYASSFGILDGWPGEGLSSAAEDSLVTIPGARVAGADTASARDDELTLVLHLKLQKDSAFDGSVVEYRLNGEQTTRQTKPSTWRFRVKPACEGGG
ncbi:hypothetical protein [Janibacter melonis]|uniref:hypothetical protein n=1 Tax=Janibacter melonis TaxID=262209 RepID=UPI001782704B|nr:hypothetical protein [Janibacter melonis]